MKIIILGAGQVGGSLACILADEGNDVTLVDENAACLEEYKTIADLRTVVGRASHPEILQQADAEDADMIVALTGEDETNMVACQVAHTLFHVPTKIARVRRVPYRKHPKLFSDDAIPIDVLIRPEELVSETISRLIKYPNSLRVVEFADGQLLLVAVRAEYGGQLVGKYLHEIPTELPGIEARVAAIYRDGTEMITPDGDTRIEHRDIVFFITADRFVRSMTVALHSSEKPYKRIFIAGGGRIGTHLAEVLMPDYQVKIIDYNQARSEMLAERLNDVVVLQGDAISAEIMLEENMDCMDVFCAVTNDDEDNILSSMMAKHLGVRKTMALINRPRYVDLIQQGSIDVAISPQQDSISALLRHIRKGDVAVAYSLNRGKAEAIEAIAHGDQNTSQVVGKSIDNISLPEGAGIGAVVRGEEVIMAHHDLIIETDDHVILFVSNKKYIPAIERLFQVKATFF